jgi:hypothetical protein
MFDFFTCIISFFLLGVLVLIIWIGVKFLYSIATIGQSKSNYNQETDKQLLEDSKEDSQGDGLVLFDDPLFPEEFDN